MENGHNITQRKRERERTITPCTYIVFLYEIWIEKCTNLITLFDGNRVKLEDLKDDVVII